MASYLDWLILSKSQGNGTETVQVSAQEHTGRLQRENTLVAETISGSNVASDRAKVVQAGATIGLTPVKDEYVIDAGSAEDTIVAVTLTGLSNGQKLQFNIAEPELASIFDIKVVPASSSETITVINGETIAGDPGASNMYTWTTIVHVKVNKTIHDRTVHVTIIAADDADVSVQKSIDINQIAGDAALTLSTSLVTLNAKGFGLEGEGTNPATLDVTSNADWQIQLATSNVSVE